MNSRASTCADICTAATSGTPLEICAYELDGRFIMGSVGFDVEAEVRSWIERGRF